MGWVGYGFVGVFKSVGGVKSGMVFESALLGGVKSEGVCFAPVRWRQIGFYTLLKQEASELFFFHVELWAENNNPQHRHTLFANSKINFSEKLYIRQKILHESFEIFGQDRICSFCLLLQNLFWSSSFWDIYCYIYRA